LRGKLRDPIEQARAAVGPEYTEFRRPLHVKAPDPFDDVIVAIDHESKKVAEVLVGEFALLPLVRTLEPRSAARFLQPEGSYAAVSTKGGNQELEPERLRKVSRRLRFQRFRSEKNSASLTAATLIAALDSIEKDLRVQQLTETSRLTLVSHGSNRYQLALSTGNDCPELEHNGELKDFDHRAGWIANSCFFSFFAPNLIGLIKHKNGPQDLHLIRFIARQLDPRLREVHGTIGFWKLADLDKPEDILRDVDEFHQFELVVAGSDHQLNLLEDAELDTHMGKLISDSEPDLVKIIMLSRTSPKMFDGWVRKWLTKLAEGKAIGRQVKKLGLKGKTSRGEEMQYNLLKKYCEFQVDLPTKKSSSRVLDPIAAFAELDAVFLQHRDHILNAKLVLPKKGTDKSIEDAPSLLDE
jgi:hypothetical protein